jgi:hypothetical protein
MARTPSYQSNQQATGSGSVVITKPVSLAVGDLMVAQIHWTGPSGGNSLTTIPSGFTQIIQTAGGIASTLFKKIADAGDVAATNFTFADNDGSQMMGAISRFTGVYSTTPVDQSNGAAQTSTGSLTTTGITPTLSNNLTLIFTSTRDADGAAPTTSGYAVTTTNPPTWTEAYDQQLNPGGAAYSIAMAYAERDPVTSTGNTTATLSDADTSSTVIQVINLPFTPISSIVGTLTVLNPVTGIVPSSLFAAYSIFNPTLPDSISWANSSKNTSSWSNGARANTSWSSANKSSSTWDNQDKTP